MSTNAETATTKQLRSPDAQSWGSPALVVGAGAMGVLMLHWPMIASGFGRIQTDLNDSRLIQYLLEHGFLWMRRAPGHRDLWSPPFYYPAPNAAAYSDLLLTFGPVYWLYRLCGATPDLSFGLWMVSMSALNYAAGLLLFCKGLRFGMPATVAGASLVAFAAPRANQMNHQQLLPCFYVIFSIYALSRLAGDRSNSKPARAGYWLLAAVAAVAQLYGGAYMGWFLIVGTALFAAGALIMRDTRWVVISIFLRDLWAIVLAGAVGIILMQPFLAHYKSASSEVKGNYYPAMWALEPRISSWLDVGPGSLLWGFTAGQGPRSVEIFAHEHRLGIGFLTPLACAIGFYFGRGRPICRLAALVAGVIWMATTFMPGRELSFLAAVVCYYCAAGLFAEVDDPVARGVGLAIVVAFLIFIRFPNPYEVVLGLSTIAFCVLEILRLRQFPAGWITPALAIVLLALKFFPAEIMPIGVATVGAIAGLLAYYNRSRFFEIGVLALGLLMCFLAVITFLNRWEILVAAVLVPPFALTLSSVPGARPPARLLIRAMLIAIPFLTLFYHTYSIWLEYYSIIPGASAMRAIGRVVLILLIPAGLGLASLVEYLARRGKLIAGWAVTLGCLLEQGVTTETFDAAANRRAIGEVARRVDRGTLAFYYHPCEEQPFQHYQLDAMWASLATGVPTINGTSGYAPPDWIDFFNVDKDPPADLKDVLARWEQARGLPPDRIQWIGEDCPGVKRTRAREASSTNGR